MTKAQDTTKRIQEIAPGFYTIRAPLRILVGLINIGTHMSLIRLSNGHFIAVDTVELDPALKAEMDELTDNGKLIAACLGTHPYHTLYFPGFYKAYPNVKFYGSPRHLRIFPDVPWAGDLNEESTRKLWEPEVEMRIPAGSEFVNPLPELTNHFSCVFVFHKSSKTIHIDDTVSYYTDPGFGFRMLTNCQDGTMAFHLSITNVGLLPTAEAPQQFKCWVAKLLQDWDFDNVATAHNGFKIGGAKKQLQELLDSWNDKLDQLSSKRTGSAIAMGGDGKGVACECG
ncbi:hypothetical protein HDU97_007524 [Phlyctochytrium planicorne]|nr:hypothetical protein HDU97_007524 [Phlyctochytrium planicorne]